MRAGLDGATGHLERFVQMAALLMVVSLSYFVIRVTAVDWLLPGCESKPALVIVAVLLTVEAAAPVARTVISTLYSARLSPLVMPRELKVQVTVFPP